MIVHVLYKGKTETLTQVPQGIDGLWLGRPGPVLPRGGFLSGAQHSWNTGFIISLRTRRRGVASLGRGYSAAGLAGVSRADPWHLKCLGGLGAPRAALHAFIMEGEAFPLLMSQIGFAVWRRCVQVKHALPLQTSASLIFKIKTPSPW